MNTHEHYEELSALAASGQATVAQLSDLRVHLEGCPSCRGAIYDFTQISAQGLAQVAAKRLHCDVPVGMTDRFLARARSEGIEISRENVAQVLRPKQTGSLVKVFAAAAAILVIALLVISRYRPVPAARIQPPDAGPIENRAVSAAPIRGSFEEDSRLKQQIGLAQSEITSLRATIESQRKELETTHETETSLTSQLAAAAQEAATTRAQNAQLARRIGELEANLAQAKSEKGAIEAAVTVQESELRELRNKLAEQQSLLHQQEELAARGSDVRDLVVARNLHIIDVHDRDGSGKNQRAFGRIFYTEGKSLIFYAYDLADPRKLDAKVSFYVWGERLGAEKPISSLGVFHNDDPDDGRWVLTFDDAQVLAQINSVFVTAESSKKTVKEPGGKRLLFAFLGDKPNHP